MTTDNNELQTLARTAEYKQGYGRDISFASDGHLWATATTGTLHLWKDAQLLKTIDVTNYVNGSIQFSPDSKTVYVGAWRIDTTTYEATSVLPNRDILVASIPLEDNPRSEQFSITHAEWVADGSLFVVRTKFRLLRQLDAQDDYTGPENQILIIDVLTPYLIADLELDTRLFPAQGLCVTDKWIATGGADVEVWDIKTGDPLQSLESDDYCQCVCFSPDQALLATTHNDGTIYLWETQNWLDNIHWRAHDGVTRGVAFHPSKPVLASFGKGEQIKLWSFESNQPKQFAQITMERDIEGLAFHPSGNQLYVTASYPAPAVSVYPIKLD